MAQFTRHLLLCVVALLALLAAFTGLRWAFADRLPAHNFGWSGFASQPKLDYVFIGSSRTRQGYDLVALEQSASCQGYALAYNGLSPALVEPFIDEVISTFKGRKATVVVEATARGLFRGLQLRDSRLLLQVPPQAKLRLLERLQESGLGLQKLLLLGFRTDNETLFAYPLVRPILERGSYRGAVNSRVKRGLTREAFERLSARDGDMELEEANALQIAGMEGIISKLKASGLNFLFADPPLPAPIANLPKIRAGKEQLRELLSARGVRYINGDELVDNRNYEFFVDGSHLSAAGRLAYMQALTGSGTPLIPRCE